MSLEFITTISSHRILGSIILPYVVTKKNDQKFFTVKDRLTLKNINIYKENLPDQFVKLIEIIEQYDENEIAKVFSKKKQSSSDFLNSLSSEIIEKNIRPYIEQRMIKCIDIIKNNNIPLFFKDQVLNIHFEDRIEVVTTLAETIFHFMKEDIGLKYFLSIKFNNSNLKLTNKAGLILVNNPCRLILENQLFFFNDIDGKKLIPFFSKEYISIPKTSEKKYLETFVRNSIRDYPVETSGFKLEFDNSISKIELSHEKSLNDENVLFLKFTYDKNSVFIANKKTTAKVLLNENNGYYEFLKIERNLAEEQIYVDFIKNLGLKEGANNGFYLQKQDTSCYDMINWLSDNKAIIENKGIQLDQNYFNNIYSIDKITLDISIQKENDWFDIHAIVKIGSHLIPFIKFKRNILKNIREYELPDGKIAVLPDEWFEKYRDIFIYSGKNDKELRFQNFHLGIISQSIELPDSNIIDQLKKVNLQKDDQNIEIPEGLNATLRPYQRIGYKYMLSGGNSKLGVCLADDMGLGKTLQTLTVLLYRINNKENIVEKIVSGNQPKQLSLFDNIEVTKVKERQASLIVMPASLIHNWYNEIQKFTQKIKVYIYTGVNRNKDLSSFGEYDILLTTYGTLRVDFNILSNYHFFYVILDESQVIKNFQSKTYKAAIHLRSKYRIVLTGTPIENSLSDLWAQLNFLNNGLLGNFNFFKEEFINPIEKLNDENKQRKLKQLIQPFILRRTKQEVASDLPELNEQTIYCDLTEEQEKIYEAEKSKIRNSILENIDKKGIENSAFIVLQGLTKLRQLANHPALTEENYKHDSGKFEEITRNLDNLAHENHKALIFSSFVKHLNLFEAYCQMKGYKFALLTGETRNREEAVKQFQNEKDVKFFLISLKAGGVGLNLTAAEYVFILDPWWNPAIENQAINRAHRIGQKNRVFVYRFISNNTIEGKIQELKERKSRLAKVFIHSNNPFKELSLDNVLELFQ